MSPVSVVVLNMLCTPRGAIELDALGNDTFPAWVCDCRLPYLRMLGEISASGIVTTSSTRVGHTQDAAGTREGQEKATGEFDVRHL